jgi:membrane fusion protein (multidrug efflux system)
MKKFHYHSLYTSFVRKEEQQLRTQGPAKFAVQKNYHGGPRHTEISRPILKGSKMEIRPKVNGFIQIYVDEGQTVRKGQILFKLETEMLNQDASASKPWFRRQKLK